MHFSFCENTRGRFWSDITFLILLVAGRGTFLLSILTQGSVVGKDIHVSYLLRYVRGQF